MREKYTYVRVSESCFEGEIYLSIYQQRENEGRDDWGFLFFF